MSGGGGTTQYCILDSSSCMIVSSIVGGMLFITSIGTIGFLTIAQWHWRSEGMYKHNALDQNLPRLQLDNMMKLTPLEWLV